MSIYYYSNSVETCFIYLAICKPIRCIPCQPGLKFVKDKYGCQTCKCECKLKLLMHFPLHFIALHCIALRCVALRCVALRCVALRCVALHCIALHGIAFSHKMVNHKKRP